MEADIQNPHTSSPLCLYVVIPTMAALLEQTLGFECITCATDRFQMRSQMEPEC